MRRNRASKVRRNVRLRKHIPTQPENGFRWWWLVQELIKAAYSRNTFSRNTLKKMVQAAIENVHKLVEDIIINTEYINSLSKSSAHDEENVVAEPSTVTDNDIKELEQILNRHLPKLYVYFLQYKHFDQVLPVGEILFYSHEADRWRKALVDSYSWEKEKFADQGYVPFAHYHDWGIVCFNTNQQSDDDNDCQVVMIDHDLIYDEPMPKEVLYSSFAEMVRSLVSEQEGSVSAL